MKSISSSFKLFVSGILLLVLVVNVSAQSILIDIGSPADGRLTELAGWNNVTSDDWDVDGLLSDFALVDTNDNATDVTFSITSRFTGINAGGADNAIDPFAATAVKDNWYFGTDDLNPIIEIGGLNINATYTLDILASRNGITDTRSADLTVTGTMSSMQQLDATNNTSSYITFASVAPNSSGVISLSFAHTSGSTFAYLNGLQITSSSAVPEPGSFALILGSFITLTGLITRRRRTA